MFMLVNAKGFNDPIGWLVLLLQGLVTGAYFPVNELPQALQVLAKCLPQTYAIDLARRLLLSNEAAAPPVRLGSLAPIQTDLVMLAAFVLTVPLLGAWCVHTGLRKAQRDGGLSRWA